MDHINSLDECMRCRSCDIELGWEVVKNCTPTENAECSCAKNHFCNSSHCDHCETCTVCENGLVEKECTSTSDTVCRMQGTILKPGMVYHLLYFERLLELYCKEKKKKKHTKPTNRCQCQEHSFLFTLLDVDLSRHVPDIVREMTLDQVKTFVRYHQLSEPTIDEIILDNCNNTSEQKIKLFQKWYQRHGIKGAYETLINSLRDLKMRAVADKIEEKLKAAVSNEVQSPAN
uniref:Tumor necrosis factor receptor superfamily member 6 n=1 Tax=Pavo cristatus TaxID=9049 RepID=A0A8C9FCA6_PAVCR